MSNMNTLQLILINLQFPTIIYRKLKKVNFTEEFLKNMEHNRAKNII